MEKRKKNYYTVTGYITAGSQNVSDSSSWHSFKPKNGHVGQVVAKNNLYLCIYMQCPHNDGPSISMFVVSDAILRWY